MKESQTFRERVGRIDDIVRSLESEADPAIRAQVKELVQALMDLHGGAIERMLEIVSRDARDAPRISDSLAADELTASLLVLYDLHPESFETRVQRGVDRARQLLRKRGAEIELLAIADAAVRLRVTAGAHGCGSTLDDLKNAVRDALLSSAPDAEDLVIEGLEPTASGFVSLASIQGVNGAPVSPPSAAS